MNDTEAADRERWNAIYREGSHRSLEPDASLARLYAAHIEPAFAHKPDRSALDLAGGVGRNALWLAGRGWRVTLNDLSDEAIRAAAQAAGAARLTLTLREESAAATLRWSHGRELRCDLILLLYFLERPLFPLLRDALAPGGMLLIKTRTEDHPRFRAGSHHPEYFLERGELLNSFRDLRVIDSSEENGMAELLVQA